MEYVRLVFLFTSEKNFLEAHVSRLTWLIGKVIRLYEWLKSVIIYFLRLDKWRTCQVGGKWAKSGFFYQSRRMAVENWVSVEVDYTETLKERICGLDKGIIENILVKSVRSLIWVSSNEVDEPRASYRMKSEREKQMSYINAYLWNLERWYWWSYSQSSSGDADIETRLWTRVGGRQERVRWMERVAWKHIRNMQIDSQWKFAVWLQELRLGLCNNLERGGS